MSFPVDLAIRYLGSKRRGFASVVTVIAILGVTLGVAALVTVMSVTGGFQEQFREKVLGVNAHVLVLKYDIHFQEYREIMKKVEHVPGVTGVAPFVINPMMVTHGDRTATGVLLKGVDPDLMPKVLDLPKHVVEGSLVGLRKPGATPPERPLSPHPSPFDRLAARDREGDAGDAPSDGGSARDDRPILDIIGDQIAAEDRLREAGVTIANAPPPAPKNDADGDETAEAIADAGKLAAAGSMAPDGGYASQLPDDDALPESVDPDPCRSAAQVAALPGVVVGRTLAKQLAVGIGDCVQITSPTIGVTLGAIGARKQFRVIAVFEAGFDQYDSKLVYTDLYEAQAFYEQGDSVTGVEMKIDDIDNSRAVSKEIEQILAKDPALPSGLYHTMDWKELNHGLFTALRIQQVGMSVVLMLIIVVAAFTEVATLIIVVLDKKREIALLKALGAKDDAILRVFVYQGAIIGVIGTALGLIIGYGTCVGLLAYGFPLDPKVYFISRLPVNLRPAEFLITAAIALVICIAAALFPAAYAARLRPADGLRAE